jgi:hypothetical protein
MEKTVSLFWQPQDLQQGQHSLWGTMVVDCKTMGNSSSTAYQAHCCVKRPDQLDGLLAVTKTGS